MIGTSAMKIVLMASQWWAAASKNSSDWTRVRPGCTPGGGVHVTVGAVGTVGRKWHVRGS